MMTNQQIIERCREALRDGKDEVRLTVPHRATSSVTHFSILKPDSPDGLVVGLPVGGGTEVIFHPGDVLHWLLRNEWMTKEEAAKASKPMCPVCGAGIVIFNDEIARCSNGQCSIILEKNKSVVEDD